MNQALQELVLCPNRFVERNYHDATSACQGIRLVNIYTTC
jgi:hypothetical protein